jgi:amidohydrolase
MSPLPAGIVDDVVGWRRRLHRRPELGFAEHETSAFVEGELREAGLHVRRVAQTGLVATLAGSAAGKTIALRADMDALPITEHSGVEFTSEIPGVMHACGHDAHTAMLLAAAVSLSREREALAGTVKFLFQPAEEGPGGAKPMIDAGVMESPAVEAVAAIHVWPTLPAKAIGLRRGMMTASCDDFVIAIKGRGGHGGYPHHAVDTIPIAALIVTSLQQIASREVDPLDSVVISIGKIEGGYRRNVIADETRMHGTIRCLDETVRAAVAERIERIVAGICEAHRAAHSIDFEIGYPAVKNDPELTDRVMDIAARVPEVSNVHALDRPTMGAEDFSYFAAAAPGCFIRLGCAAPGDTSAPSLHSPEFRVDESTLATGVALFRALAFHLTSP